MSILTNVAIPLHPLSPQRANKVHRGRPEARNLYSDEPLLVKPSTHAPRQARIVSRVAESGVPLYLLQIGDVSLPDVGLDEVLDYVSPRELEEFETRQFEEENEILRIAEAARQAEREAARERAKERAKRKGVVIREGSDDRSSSDEADVEDAPLGRHGRARPSYTHLYEVPQRRRRRKRDPITGGLLPLDDQDTDTATDSASSQDEPPGGSTFQSHVRDSPELPKRRRRRRDKVTGQLLPLSPQVQAKSKVPLSTEQLNSSSDHFKRRRRRRHPITKELMPLGWRYEQEVEGRTAAKEIANADLLSSSSNRDGGTKYGSDIKRLKLASDVVVPTVESSLGAGKTYKTDQSHWSEDVARTNVRTPIQILSDEDIKQQSSEDSENDPPESLLQRFVTKSRPKSPRPAKNIASSTGESSSKPPPEQLTLASFLAGNRKLQRRSSTSPTTPEAVQKSQVTPKASLTRPPALTPSTKKSTTAQTMSPQEPKSTALRKTSIKNPVASRIPVNDVVDLCSEEEMPSKDEWFVEAILDHRLSDPRTHDPDLGVKPVMLYYTKWQGFKQSTWEPAKSFIDSEILDDYCKKVGLRSDDVNRGGEYLERVKQASTPREKPNAGRPVQARASSNWTDEDEEGYEIETILAHHLSDPTTHAKGLGRDPVMLYLVKWVGFKDPTWEPVDSFLDRGVIQDYERRVVRKPTIVK